MGIQLMQPSRLWMTLQMDEFNITAYDKTGNVFNVTQAIITGENVIIDTIRSIPSRPDHIQQ